MKISTERDLDSGYTLYVEINEVGCRRYWSDEIGGGVMVWDTALVDHSTLLAALAMETGLRLTEARRKRDAKNQCNTPAPGQEE